LELAALLPKRSADHIRRIVPETSIVFARGCDELRQILSTGLVACALIDPNTDGDNTVSLLDLMEKHPEARIIAYVEATPSSLQAVFRLSKHGLEQVFLHPVNPRDRRFLNAIENLSAHNLSYDLISALEPQLAALPLPIMGALVDVFRRPYRYKTANDIAYEAGVSTRSLYRAFQLVPFGPPKQTLAVAKVAYGYCNFCTGKQSIADLSHQLGYTKPFCFSNQVRHYLGNSPTDLRRTGNKADVFIALVESLCKPPALQRKAPVAR
jgi:AraC-like DNA-binding protein